MKSKLIVLLTFSVLGHVAFAQQVTGHFPFMPNETIKLKGFQDFDAYTIDSTQTDEEGRFTLSFNQVDYGVGRISSENMKPFIVILADENVHISANALDENVDVNEGKQNMAYTTYAKEQPLRDQALSAWNFLENKYNTEDLFSSIRRPKRAIVREIKRIKNEEAEFLDGLTDDTFIRWYIPMRKLLSSVSRVAQYEIENIPETRDALRAIDYSDDRLYKSGLLREAIENHVWFIENSSGPLDTVFADLNTSIDIMLEQLVFDERKYNMVTDFLFNVLEKRSLFTSAEYLALKVLNEQSCTVDGNLANQLEGYRKMKTGNTAPDITFTQYTYHAEGVEANKLSDIGADYKLVIFAASWCGHCTKEIPRLAKFYDEWKALGVEMVMVSLDENVQDFVTFVGGLPFTSTTDLKKWDAQAAQDYYVFGTPTMFLLNNAQEILLKPKSVDHLKSWIDWRLKPSE